MSAMIEAMTKQGLRITEQRKTLANLFADPDQFLTPKDVYDQMSSLYPSVSFDTIYRNLRMLSEMGVLEQVYFMEGGLRFKASCSGHHHHHFICVTCERTYSVHYCPMTSEVQAQVPDKFRVLHHRFEMFGVCAACQSEEEERL